jgi:hypothetical protein
VDDIPRWLTDVAFAGLVHTQLRHLIVSCDDLPRLGGKASDCAFQLQQRHFPRRRFTFNEEAYPVSKTE